MQAECLLKKGMELLRQAQLEKFKQTATLTQTVAVLRSSIKLNCRQPET